jgi:hypothetical protein
MLRSLLNGNGEEELNPIVPSMMTPSPPLRAFRIRVHKVTKTAHIQSFSISRYRFVHFHTL